MMFLRVSWSQILKTYKKGNSTTSLGNLLYCLTVLMWKKFLITLTLELPCINLGPLPLILPPSAFIKSLALALIDLPIRTRDCYYLSLHHLFPTLNKPGFLRFSSQNKCSRPDHPGRPYPSLLLFVDVFAEILLTQTSVSSVTLLSLIAPRAFSAELLPKLLPVSSLYCCQGVLHHQPWFDCLRVDILRPFIFKSESKK